jgi:outer membrane receptor protein involved in Fe transport
MQLKYSFPDNFNLRIAYTHNYARPNFEDVLPYREEDREEVKYGNPDLKFPRAYNVDFLAEYYPENHSIFSGGIFYKKIDDFIFYFKRFAHEGKDFSDYGIVEIEKAVNGIEAHV